MSSEIFYDKAFIRVGEQFIPVVNHGSSNCFEVNIRGREIPEKSWSVINYPHWDKMLFTAEEMKELAATYEKISMDNVGGTRKSRYRSFEEGEFYRWILGGMKTAHTVEEYRKYGNSVVIVEYAKGKWSRFSVSSTEELLKKLDEFAGKNFTVSFFDNRYVNHPPMRKQRQLTDYSLLPEYYVLKAEQGYFVKRSSRRIWFVKKLEFSPNSVRKFKSAATAEKYLQENQKVFAKIPFSVECVKNA